MRNNSRIAFTLAEVLITLGVIGVVAALTMPTLIKNHNKMVWTKSLARNYSILSQSCQKALADEEVFDISQTDYYSYIDTADWAHKISKKHFRNANVYEGLPPDVSDIKNCYNNCAYHLGNITEGYGDGHRYTVELPGSTVVIVNGGNSILYYVDVNGYKKKPNRIGQDLFMIMLTGPCKLYSAADWKSFCPNKFTQSDISTGYFPHVTYGCFQRVMGDGWEIKYDPEY